MKTWKLFWVLVFVGVMSSGFLTACGKGGDDSRPTNNNNLNSGSLSSDGSTVTSSNSTLAGRPIAVTITNITRGYGGGYPNNYYGGYPNNSYSGYGQQSISFVMSVNGQSANLQATTSESGFVTQLGGVYVDTAIGCYDVSCNTVLLAVIVAGSGGYGGGYEYKEIAIRKNMVNNQVEAVREFQGGTAQMVPINQLMSQM